MDLTTAQLQTIKTDIANNGDLNAFPNTPDGNQSIADLYNLTFSPTFTVWKTMVKIGEIGNAFDSAELGGLTTANQSRLQTMAMYLAAGVNPSIAANRAFFDDVFSGAGGQNTRASLAILWKRAARRIEKLFATGTGTSVSPATLVVEGKITSTDVLNARNS